MISGLFELILILIRLYTWIIIAAAVFSLLASSGVIDTRNRIVYAIGDFLYRATEPALRPIRRFMPDLGNIDISPLILILVLQFLLSPLVHGLYAFIMTGSPQAIFF